MGFVVLDDLLSLCSLDFFDLVLGLFEEFDDLSGCLFFEDFDQ